MHDLQIFTIGCYISLFVSATACLESSDFAKYRGTCTAISELSQHWFIEVNEVIWDTSITVEELENNNISRVSLVAKCYIVYHYCLFHLLLSNVLKM
jgi:hypothetical protein